MTSKKRARILAKLSAKCKRLYSSKTSKRDRGDLSLEVACLRAQLGAPTAEAMLRKFK